MQQKSFVIFTLLFFSVSIIAQQNYEQEIINLSIAGKYFEVKELYHTIKTENYVLEPTVNHYYKYKMAEFQNKPDNAAVYLEELLEDGDNFGKDTFTFLDRLWGLYTYQLQDYKKAINTYNKMQAYLERKRNEVDSETLANWQIAINNREKQILRRRVEPQIRIQRDHTADSIIDIKEGNNQIIRLDVDYNSTKKVSTFFDTGSTYFFMIKDDVAKEIGVRKLIVFENDSLRRLNGQDLPIEEGILDSIKIANIKIYNIPVFVYRFNPLNNMPDSILNSPSRKEFIDGFVKDFNIIMGLPIINLLKRVAIDWENKTLTFPTVETNKQTSKISNLYLFNSSLYTRAKLNGLYFTGFIDTGKTSYIDIDSTFYEKHREKIPLDTLAVKKSLNYLEMHTAVQNIPYEVPKDPNVVFNDKKVSPSPTNPIQIYDVDPDQTMKSFDGVLGIDFIRSLGDKVLFDFESMRIEAIE